MHRYAYELALRFDKAPVNSIAKKIPFWHASDDYKPTLYDELGYGAAQSIDTLFYQEPIPSSLMPEKIIEKMKPAERYWNEIKR